MVDSKVLYYRGILRKCTDCDFETTERREMRKHERTYNHTQNKEGTIEAKRYSEEERAARLKQKHGNRV